MMQGGISFYSVRFVILCALFGKGAPDFNCVCNYHVELAVHQKDDKTSSLVGYMYEFDCKPEAPNVKTSGGMLAVMFEQKLGFVESDSNVLIQICPGNIPAVDMWSPTTAMAKQTLGKTTYTTPLTTRRSTQSTTITPLTSIPTTIITTPTPNSTTTTPTTSTSTPSTTMPATTQTTSTSSPSTTTQTPTSLTTTTTMPTTVTSTQTSTTPTPTTTAQTKTTSTQTTTTSSPSTSTQTPTTLTTTTMMPTSVTSTQTSTTPTTTTQTATTSTSTTTTQITTTSIPITTTLTTTSSATTTSTPSPTSTIPIKTTTTATTTPTLPTTTTSTPTTTTSKTTITTPTATTGTTISTTSYAHIIMNLDSIHTENPDICPKTPNLVTHTSLTRYCYEFVLGANNSPDKAEPYCNIKGGHLLSISSVIEDEYIYQVLLSKGATNFKFWTGLSIANGFQWSDGSSNNYALKFPHILDTYGGCVLLDTERNELQLYRSNCSTKHPFICKYNASNTGNTVTGPPTATTLAPTVHTVNFNPGATEKCPDAAKSGIKSGNSVGLAQHDRNCYEVIRETYDWPNAFIECVRRGGNLLNITSSDERVYVEHILQHYGIQQDVWLWERDYHPLPLQCATLKRQLDGHWKTQTCPLYWMSQKPSKTVICKYDVQNTVHALIG